MPPVDSGHWVEQGGSCNKGYIDINELVIVGPIVSNSLHIIQNQIQILQADRPSGP